MKAPLYGKTSTLGRFTTELDSSMAGVSAQMKDIRASLAGDEKTSLMMDALRGKNLNDDDMQGQGIDMKVVNMRKGTDASDVLPTVYDPVLLDAYFKKRPGAVFQRVFQILSASTKVLGGVVVDYITGNTEDIEVRRAAELRNTIVSLGPFFIKLGQALSIRPDILSPRSMVELQQLCDKVPCFPSDLAMETIKEELGRTHTELFSEITAEPVAAASLGQVYKATLRDSGEVVAVKVQRPYVLETVSLDLHLLRNIGLFIRNFPDLSSRLDLVSLLDEFAGNFYQELDYNLECQNGIKIAEDMKRLPMVLIPKNYPAYTNRRVHTAQWIDGEKLSQSTADDVSSLVNLGVITYLTQLLDTGFFHADPHPGNMLRSPDGRLVILDFGLMTKITDNQKYGMIEAIAHLIHRDYKRIGDDFVNLDFIPEGVDTKPIIPALARVFEAALAGGGAKSINFQELAADLAEITFAFPFRIPPYFALIIRAISVLEGIALVGNPEFAIVDEAYPYISKRLMTDSSPRLKEAFRYMVYGNSKTMDIDRMIDMLEALEKFVAVKDFGDGGAFKKDGVRGGTFVGQGGDSVGTKKVDLASPRQGTGGAGAGSASSVMSPIVSPAANNDLSREALKFFFSEDGALVREFVLDEISSGVDAISRDAARELIVRLGIFNRGKSLPPLLKSMAPKLSKEDRDVVDNIVKLVNFLLGNKDSSGSGGSGLKDSFSPSPSTMSGPISSTAGSMPVGQSPTGTGTGGGLDFQSILQNTRKLGGKENRDRLNSLVPVFREFAPNMREFGLQVVRRLTQKATSRFLKASSQAIFGRQ